MILEEIEISLGFIFKVILYLLGVAPVIVTQIIIFNKLKWDVEQLKNSVNGIGTKVNNVKDNIDNKLSKGVDDHSQLKDRVSRVEGGLDTFIKIFVPSKSNGHS